MKSEETNFEKKIEQLVSALADTIYTYANFLTNCCLKIIDSEDYHEQEKRFFYSLLFKVTNELVAVSTLFKNFFQKSAVQSSMYLILRTILSDCFASWHVIKLKESKQDFLYMIKLIEFDHISYTIKNLKGVYNQIHRLSPLELEEEIQKLKALHPSFFEILTIDNGQPMYGESIFGKDYYSMKKTATYLANQKLIKEERELLKKMFHYYNYYSKLEHPGILTFTMVHKSFNHLAFRQSLKDFIDTMFCIEPFIATYLSNWLEIQLSVDTEYAYYLKLMQRQSDSIHQELKRMENI